MVELMEQEGVVGLRLRSYAETLETRVVLGICGVPVLGVGWVAHHGIHAERLSFSRYVVLRRPVLGQRVSAPRVDVVGLNAPHDEVHAGKVVGALLKLLGIIDHTVRIGDVLAHRLADSDKQRSGTARRVVDGDGLAVLEVLGDDFRHEHRHLVGRVELTGFLARIGGKVGNKIFIDVAQHIVVLLAIGGNVADELDEILQGACLCRRALAKLLQASPKRVEDALIHIGEVGSHESVEAVECHAQVRYAEVAAGLEPCAEKIPVLDEIAYAVLT